MRASRACAPLPLKGEQLRCFVGRYKENIDTAISEKTRCSIKSFLVSVQVQKKNGHEKKDAEKNTFRGKFYILSIIIKTYESLNGIPIFCHLFNIWTSRPSELLKRNYTGGWSRLLYTSQISLVQSVGIEPESATCSILTEPTTLYYCGMEFRLNSNAIAVEF